MNGNGDQFTPKYTEAAVGDTTRDILSMAIAREVMEGRGTPHGGVYLLLGKAPVSLLESHHFQYLRRIGVNLETDKVEVAPGAHFWLGGIAIDAIGSSSVPGLFAAGETTGGLHGANRLAGNALSEAIVFGEKAGFQAALFANEWGIPKNVAEESPCLEFLVRNRMGSKKPQYFVAELQKNMQESFGVLRRGSTMRQGLRSLL